MEAQAISRKLSSQVRGTKKDFEARIAVRESLHYDVEISARTYVKTVQTNGVIEIVVSGPSRRHLEDETSDQEPVGYLGISNYETTSWVDRLRGNSDPARIPIPPPSPSKDSAAILRFKYEINPKDSHLGALPVFVEAEITDDEELGSSVLETGISFHNKMRLALTIRSEVIRLSGFDEERILNFLQEQVGSLQEQVNKQAAQGTEVSGEEVSDADSSGRALKESQAKLKVYEDLIEYYEKEHRQESIWSTPQEMSREVLREIAKKSHEHNLQELSSFLAGVEKSLRHKVKLDYIGVQVPYVRHSVRNSMTMGEDESKQIKSKQITWIYNPQRQCLELRDQVLTWNPDTNLYETVLYLDLDPPTEELAEVKGSLVLHIDEVFSGLRVEWSDGEKTDKREEDEDLEPSYTTWLKADFTIALDQVFEARSFKPQRQLHFEGVVPQRHHINNITNILSNHGLTILVQREKPCDDTEERRSRNEQHSRYVIIALRQGAYRDFVGVDVKGRKRTGQRIIYYNDEQEQITQTVDVGTLDITLAAWMKRPSEKVNHLLNLIQLDIERYFVSTAEVGIQEDHNAG